MKKIFILLIGIICLVSCNTSQRAYQDLEGFTEYIENYSDTFSDDDWEVAIMQYNAIVENVDSHVYTDEELIAIGKLKGRCAVQFVKYSVNSTSRNINNFLLEADGFLQSIMDGFSE